MLQWEKLGQVYLASENDGSIWMSEFAQCPTPFLLDENTVRVFISCRPPRGSDMQYISYPGYVDLDRHDLRKVIGLSESPLLPHGRMGSFDEFGIMPCSVVRHKHLCYMYYTGWTRMSSVPYTVDIGLAVSEDGGQTFKKAGEGPVMGLTPDEPYLVNTPVVQIHNDIWHMWYLTGTKWIQDQTRFEPVFHLVHAQSLDGIQWERNAQPILIPKTEDECQDVFSPFFHQDRWHAAYAYRDPRNFRGNASGAYQIGYAWSTDLLQWTRDDNFVGLKKEQSGWDSEMMCSSQAINIDGQIYLFYCGNEFGKYGFGIAKLKV